MAKYIYITCFNFSLCIFISKYFLTSKTPFFKTEFFFLKKKSHFKYLSFSSHYAFLQL